MALKIRCAFCDELMQYREDADNYTCCVCGTVTRLPEGKATSNPYQGWGAVYEADRARRRPDATSSSNRGRKYKKTTRPPRWGSDYGEC